MAANFTINVTDGPNEGFNDSTLADPIGGNTATTIGEQRIKVLELAVQIWGSVLDSQINIEVDASFDPLTCSAQTAILGAGGPTTVHINFANRPYVNTLYVQAEANSLSNSDLSPASDIQITLNSSIDNNSNCLNNTNWYLGLDGQGPSNSIDLLTVLLHEIAHGLGFTTFVDLETGAKSYGYNDAYMKLVEDHSLNKTWDQMTNSQRAASAVDDPDLHWDGNAVNSAIAQFSSGVDQNHIRLYGPASLTLGSSVAHFSSDLYPNELMEPSFTSHQSLGLADELLQDIGWQLMSNQAPVVSQPQDGEVTDSESYSTAFVVYDNDTDLSGLNITATSSNQSIVQDGAISISGTGHERVIVVTPGLGASGSANITIAVNDGTNTTNQNFNLNVVLNNQPSLSITNPSDGLTLIDPNVNVMASASDPEDGVLSNIQWQSNIDGVLGAGESLSVVLSDGQQVLTASAVDSQGKTASHSISFSMEANSDWDLDTLTNYEELQLGTNPNNKDSDFDGIWDADDPNPLVKDTNFIVPMLPEWALYLFILMIALTYRIKNSSKSHSEYNKGIC